MRRMVMFLIGLLLAAPAFAQKVSIDFPGLADRASQTVDVTLDGPLLKLASKFLNSDDPDEQKAREIVRKLNGIYVRSYEFTKEGEYDRDAIAQRVHSQLGPSWKRIVNVQSKFSDSSEIYVEMHGDDITGVMILAADPRELTLVNLVGPVDLDQLSSLQGQFGIPHMKAREHHHD